MAWPDYAGALAALITALGGGAAAFHYVVVLPTLEKIARAEAAQWELTQELGGLRQRAADDREEVVQRLSSLEAKVDMVLAELAFRR